MPTMSMAGPSGAPTPIGPGRWRFDFSSAMATTWSVSVRFSGGVDGTAVFRFAIGGGEGASSATGNAMAGMSASGGNPDAWKWSALALAILLVAVVFVVVIRRDRRPLTLSIAVGAAFVVIAFAAIQAKYAAPAMDMTTMASIPGSAALPVTLASVQTSRATAEIHAPGTIAPLLTEDIVTRAPGILTNFTLYAGDRVARGQVIALLDAPDLQSQAAAAAADARGQAALAQAADIEAHHHAPNAVTIARADTVVMQRDISAAESERSAKAEQARYWQTELGREKSLLDQGAVSAQEYQDERAQNAAARSAAVQADEKVAALRASLRSAQTKASDALASVDQMQAQAAAARAQAAKSAAQASTAATFADYRSVRSPDDAVVVKRLVDPGVYVAAGTVIARIAVLDKLRISANVAQEDMASIAIGLPLDARLSDGRLVHARVSSISPLADSTTHTAAVEAIVTSGQADLLAGGFVQVVIHARARDAGGGLHVPSAAIVGAGADAAVWVDVNGTAHRVLVRIANDDGTTATITGDLDRRARVVIDGAVTLQEGQTITEIRA